jgi:hypothetical protein
MTSGAVIGEHDITYGQPVTAQLDYEQTTITTQTASELRPLVTA